MTQAHKRFTDDHHDREVLTNYAGEIVQHDSSHHKWSPYAQEKWYLITSLDDCRKITMGVCITRREVIQFCNTMIIA